MRVIDKEELLKYLLNNLEISNKKIKNNLKNGFIYVNGKKVTQYNYVLNKDDKVEIKKDIQYKTKLSILYEDDDIIVVNKPYGLLTIATEKEKHNTLYQEVSSYVKMKKKQNNIFIIHRLDKDTSGVIMFAKSKKVQSMYQDDWNNRVKKRGYVAISSGKISKKEDTIISNLTENSAGVVYSSRDGKEAITEYKVIKENEKYTMLDINLLTGRKNQIRVHLSEMGNPILGDRKYNGEISPIKRLCLHANVLILINPITKKINKYEARIPNAFNNVIRGVKNDK